MMIYRSSFDNHKQIVDKKVQQELDKLNVKCKFCGHTMFMKVQQDFKICTHCRRKVLNNSKAYFIYKLQKTMKKEGVDSGKGV